MIARSCPLSLNACRNKTHGSLRKKNNCTRQRQASRSSFSRLVSEGGGSRDIVIQATVETVKLRLEFESDTYSSYHAELRTQVDQQLVWSRSKLKAHAKGGNKTIDLSLRASLLKPQGYLLNLKGVTPSGEIEDVRNYLFRVVKK